MKVGDYVRTKKGEIGKIIDYIDEPTDYYFNCYVTTLKNFTDKHITEYDNNIKSSPNIKSVIEKDDFVNGERVNRVIPEDICGDEVLDYQHIFVGDKEIYEKDIKSIVTKEQFESMEYKVGE